jgi:ABC-2 type transport system ATP-binding protein
MIQVRQLTKDYGATRAIDRIDFQVEKGEIVGFLGPNGAGKSTTMRILAGALGATSGEALVGGVDVFSDPRRVKRMVGYLPEVPPLYTDMTVTDYLRFCGRIKSAKDPKRAADRVISQIGLNDVAGRLIDHLSKGYRQRVGIAQALVHQPSVLILDEPASGLDPAQRVEIRSLVRDLSDGETTVILSTHVLSEVEAICDRVVVINEGCIAGQGSMDELSGSGTSVLLRVAQPESTLEASLQSVAGVTSVTNLGEGQFRIVATRDVRADLAHRAVASGLLELGASRALEDTYLQLTGGG